MMCDEITKVFSQDIDTGFAGAGDSGYLLLRAETVSNGIGQYIVISTKRWALDSDNLDRFYHEMKSMLEEANRDK